MTTTISCTVLNNQAVMTNDTALTLALREGTIPEIIALQAERDTLITAIVGHHWVTFEKSVLVGHADDFHSDQAVRTVHTYRRCTGCGHTTLAPLFDH